MNMVNKKISLSLPNISIQEKKAVLKVLGSGMLVQGPKVKFLETQFAKLCGTKYALATNNGTSALHTALYAVGIQPDDEVITTPFTFVATANSILMVGAKPVFVDIDEKTYNINPLLIEKAITKKTKAILVVDLYGQPADYEKINKIAKKNHLLVVEDAAQSINAQYNNKKAGNLADISTFSLYATKNIISGEGGMVTTNFKPYYEKAKLFRHHGMDENKRYHYKGLGYNYRMMDLQAAIAIEQLKKVSVITSQRQKNALRYNLAFSKIDCLITPNVLPNCQSVYHQYTLRLKDNCKITRDQLQLKLGEIGIQTNIYYPIPLYQFPHLKLNKINLFPVTEQIVNQVISLPVHPLLSTKQIDYVIKSVIKYVG
jgi:perosamine synthetase